MDLSIVIPVFEEEKKIARDITAASDFLVSEGLRGEIIVVDDGSKDQTSKVAETATVHAGIELRVIRYNEHRGKGFAIRTGMKQSRGEYVMFADSGTCVPYENALTGLNMLKSGTCDMAHGSRRLPDSRVHTPQVWSRQLYSRLFRRLMRTCMKIPSELTDTQCGFKVYRGDLARELYAHCFTDGFMFDIEVILRAFSKGCQIREFPVEWTADHDSRLPQTLSLRGMLAELIAIRRSLVAEKNRLR